MRKLSESEVKAILTKHKLWLKTGGKKGKCADFSDADLSEMDFYGCDIRDADFSRSSLANVNFRNVDLRRANFRDTCAKNVNFRNAKLDDTCFAHTSLANADFRNASLNSTSFYRANLLNADFRNAKLYNVYLFRASLPNVDFCGADLTDADLNDTDMACAIYDETTFPAMACPEEGSFIGYKKAFGIRNPDKEYIVELRIPEDAKRSSATGNKCRCSKAEILSITQLIGIKARVTKVRSSYASNFIYQLGETVEVPGFDECRWHECAPGIHFFMDRDAAVKW